MSFYESNRDRYLQNPQVLIFLLVFFDCDLSYSHSYLPGCTAANNYNITDFESDPSINAYRQNVKFRCPCSENLREYGGTCSARKSPALYVLEDGLDQNVRVLWRNLGRLLYRTVTFWFHCKRVFLPVFKSWQVLSPLPSHVKDTGNTRWVLIVIMIKGQCDLCLLTLWQLKGNFFLWF